jgi:hypothetical protein
MDTKQQVTDYINRHAQVCIQRGHTGFKPGTVDPVKDAPAWFQHVHHLARGFRVGFELAFGREPTEDELLLHHLRVAEGEHEAYLKRGRTPTGFVYSAGPWAPAPYRILRMRYQLGMEGGVKNEAEYEKVYEAARKAWNRKGRKAA